MGKPLTWIKNYFGNKLYPYTHMDAVYTDDEEKKTLPTTISELKDSIDNTSKIQSDWNEDDTGHDSYIKNKPLSLPANGGNSDTLEGKHASDFTEKNIFDAHLTDSDAHQELFNSKLNIESANKLIKNISSDASTGIIMVTRQDNTTFTINIPRSLIFQSAVFNEQSNEIIITWSDHSESRIPVEGLVDIYSGSEGNIIQIEVDDNNIISAVVKEGSIGKNFLSQNVQNALDASHEHISNTEKHIPNGGISGQIIGMTDSGVEWVDLEENLTAENLGALPITGGKLESNNFPILKIKRTQSGQSSTINFESGDGELIMLEAVAANNEEHTPELWIRDRSDNTRLLHLSKQHKKIYDPTSNSLKEILVKDADLLDEIGALPLTGGTLKSNRGELDPVITMEGSENFAIMDLQSASGGIRVQQGSDSTHGNYFAVYDKSDNEKNILKISSSTHEICGKKILLQGDTVNSLLATEPGNPLDAVQGKALADMIGEINGNLGKEYIANSERVSCVNGNSTTTDARLVVPAGVYAISASVVWENGTNNLNGNRRISVLRGDFYDTETVTANDAAGCRSAQVQSCCGLFISSGNNVLRIFLLQNNTSSAEITAKNIKLLAVKIK